MRPLEISTERRGSRYDLTVAGELDLATADGLLAAVGEPLSDGERAIDVDLSRLTFCDCFGLAALVTLTERAQEAGKQLTFRHLTTQVRSVIELTGVDRELEIR